MSSGDWDPRSLVALLLGVVVLVFVAGSMFIRILHPEAPAPAAEAWKEIIQGVVGGLMVWIGIGNRNA